MNVRFHPHERLQQRGVSTGALVVLAALLFFPFLAMLRLAHSLDARWIVGYLVGVSALTFWLYWQDKRRAQNGGWRTPEFTLHLAELFGGWPAAFLAQRTFRHKARKISYQAEFWSIVTLHEAISFDFLQDWHYLQSALLFLHSLSRA